jgi:hypothetical protein
VSAAGKLEPWLRAVAPRPELRDGRSFNPDEFAIALEQVVGGTAPSDYLQPEQFFSRTYLTAAMHEQIGIVLRRLAGRTEGAPPVLSFITGFGGGKTHTLTALWHLARGGADALRLPGVAELVAREALATVPAARVGVFVGNAWDPHGTHLTPWLDLAWQLAGNAGVSALGGAMRTSPPGTAALLRLFTMVDAPILILMDEVLNFINRHRVLAEPFYAFLDNLMRAATGIRGVAVVLSLPQHASEMTQFEQDWQDRITKTVKRVARDLVGNDEAELSEIVRRRLFAQVGEPSIRTSVARLYADWCFERRAQLPAHWMSVDPTLTERRVRDVLRDRFAACYPFHPATLSVFQRKFRALPQYQQTRGMLGILAQWLSCHYGGSGTPVPGEALITLGSAPLGDRGFRAALLGQLGAPRLDPAILADLVADNSHAHALDADSAGPLHDIHRRVGTAILFECAGSRIDQAASLPELRFALGAPGLDTTSVDTAAAALAARAFFVRQVGADGYAIGSRAKLSKLVAEKCASLDADRDLLPEARRLVRQIFEAGRPLPVIAFPDDAASVRDAPHLSLLVADPTLPWDGSADLRQFIAAWTYRRGAEPRRFPAALLWCLCQPDGSLLKRVETALAWRAVRQDLGAGLLADDTDQGEIRSIDASIRAAEQDAKDAVWASYRFLAFADRQEASGLRVIDLGAGHSSSRETVGSRALAALRSHGLLSDDVGAGYVARKWPPSLAAAGAWPLSGLRQSFLDGSLIRLLDADAALRSRVIEWVETGAFGLASCVGPDGSYQTVWFRQLLPASAISFDAELYLLKPDVAAGLLDRPACDAAQPAEEQPTTITISGDLPADQWNRLGARLIPKLHAAGRLSASITLVCQIDAVPAPGLTKDLRQILAELDLAGLIMGTKH